MSNRAFRNDLRALIPRDKPQSRLAPAPIRPRIPASEGRSGEVLPGVAGGGLTDLGSPWSETARQTVTKSIPVPVGATAVEIEDPTQVTMLTSNGDTVVLNFTP